MEVCQTSSKITDFGLGVGIGAGAGGTGIGVTIATYGPLHVAMMALERSSASGITSPH